MILHRTIRLVLVAGALTFAALAPSTASAGALATDASKCGTQTFSQPFMPWADPASYTLHPGGDFEKGSPRWDTSSGAGTAGVNEPWTVTNKRDRRSLSLASGAVATSPSICVGIEHPDIRFFAKGSSALATLSVEVLYLDGNGEAQSLTIGKVSGSNGWSPTVQMPIVANLVPLLPDGRTPVAFRLTAISGSWNVDDFYVDPYAKW